MLAQLHRQYPNHFHRLLELRGRNRRYFARSAQELLASGKSTRPMAIPGSGYWVITNANGSRKVRILETVFDTLELPGALCHTLLQRFLDLSE